MTNTKQLEWLGAIDDELIITAERAGIKRPARAYLKLLPIAAAMLALITLAVAVLPGMIKGDDSAGTEGKFLSITDIPGAVEIDYSKLTQENTGHLLSTPKPLDTVISNLRDQRKILGVGTIKNMETVCIETYAQIVDANGASTDKNSTVYCYITTFDLVINRSIRNLKNGETVKCAFLHSYSFKITDMDKIYPPQAIHDIGKPMLHEAEYLYSLSPVKNSVWTFDSKEYKVSDFADYYITGTYLHAGDSFYYFNTKINYDEINK